MFLGLVAAGWAGEVTPGTTSSERIWEERGDDGDGLDCTGDGEVAGGRAAPFGWLGRVTG